MTCILKVAQSFPANADCIMNIGFDKFVVGAIFLILLFLGMVYEWRKGDLEWARPKIERLELNKLLNKEKEITGS